MNESDFIIEPDLKITGGDLVIQNANEQNIKHLLIARGNYLLNPGVGVGIYRYQNATITDFRNMVNEIKSQLKRDGYRDVALAGSHNDTTGKSELSVTGERKTNAIRTQL